VDFICYGAGDEEGARDVDVKDFAERCDGVITCIAFSRDGGAGYEATDRMAEIGADGGEG
jgi:hypothetical protein